MPVTKLRIELDPEVVGQKKFNKAVNKYHSLMNDRATIKIKKMGHFHVTSIEVSCFPVYAVIELQSAR